MHISQKGITLIKMFEGLELETYICAGNVLSIGYGCTQGVEPGMKITEDTAISLLKSDLISFEDCINENVNVKLTQDQFDALACFTYNIGNWGFKNSTLLKKLNKYDYKGASEELLRWTKAKGKVLKGLVRRRQAEQNLFLGKI